MEAATGLEPVIRVLQTHALPLGYAANFMERKTGVEPATSTLARWRSTTELLPQKLGYLDSNQGMTGSKPVALPLGYTPIIRWGGRGELNPRMPESQSGALTTSP